MAVNWTVVGVLRDLYTPAELRAKLLLATEEFLSGVTVTQVTFEGGGASGQRIQMSPTDIMEYLKAAMGQDTAGSAVNSAFMDLSRRPFGT